MITPPTPAAGNPCQECPFRTSNAGREHPTANYDENFVLDWKGIAAGHFFACHIFAPDLHSHDERAKEMGFKTPVETGERPECAGATIAIQRELDVAQDYPNHAEYIRARPAGLSPAAFITITNRIKGTAGPAFNVSGFDPDEIRDPATDVDTTSPYWAFGAPAVTNMLAAIPRQDGKS